MFRNVLWLLPTAFLAVGCATSTPQTDQFFKSETKVPRAHTIGNVPFILQDVGHCGPATLTMAMQAAGKPVTIDELVKQVYSPKAEGSFQLDMISAARRHGMLALPIQGIDALTTEIASNHPVIVFENLGIKSIPLWHYALVFGYDLNARELTMHSGKNPNLKESFKVFERSWKLGDYWGLVILPPGTLSPTASELDHVRAAAALEQINKQQEADKSYQAILEKWPQSLSALIGRANIAFAKKKNQQAIIYLKQATEFHPQSAAAWYNLAIAQSAQKQKMMAKKSATKALELADETRKPEFEKSLKEILN